jgi:hypothetical protein
VTRADAMVLATAVLAVGCADPSGPAWSTSETWWAAATETATTVTHVTLAIQQAVYYPCGDQIVDVSGHLSLELRSRAIDPERYELRYTAQMVNVTGRSQTGDGVYRVVGAVTGRVVGSHRDRAVTVADYSLLVLSSPGAEIGRTAVTPGFRVSIVFPISETGDLDVPFIEDVRIPKGCSG